MGKKHKKKKTASRRKQSTSKIKIVMNSIPSRKIDLEGLIRYLETHLED